MKLEREIIEFPVPAAFVTWVPLLRMEIPADVERQNLI